MAGYHPHNDFQSTLVMGVIPQKQLVFRANWSYVFKACYLPMPRSFSDRTPAEIEVRTASLARSCPSVEESLVLSFLPRPTKSKSSSSHPWIGRSWPSFNLGPDLEKRGHLKNFILKP